MERLQISHAYELRPDGGQKKACQRCALLEYEWLLASKCHLSVCHKPMQKVINPPLQQAEAILCLDTDRYIVCCGVITRMGRSLLPRFCEYEVKNLRSSPCCRQENATFYPLILGTWGLWIFRYLYIVPSVMGQMRSMHFIWVLAFPQLIMSNSLAKYSQ